MLIGISAVVIGICALGVSLYETSLMRQEQRAAVMPLLELSQSFYSEDAAKSITNFRLDLNVTNVGIGPARVSAYQVNVDGRPQDTWAHAIGALLGHGEVSFPYTKSNISGRTIPPDRSIRILSIADSASALRVEAELERLEMAACYCSVFNECWITSSRDFGAARVVQECTEFTSRFLD